jgi:hypothetical protein
MALNKHCIVDKLSKHEELELSMGLFFVLARMFPRKTETEILDIQDKVKEGIYNTVCQIDEDSSCG